MYNRSKVSAKALTKAMAGSFPLAPPAQHQLAIAPRPVEGENVHGYVRRLADANGHACLDTFLHALGYRGKIGPMSRDDAWHRLAGWTGLPVQAFDGMRWRSATHAPRPTLSVLGTAITSALVHPCSVRFCPSCLGSDGIRRNFWSLAYVVACPLHGCLLIDACSACGERFDAAPIGSPVACRCGQRFDRSTEKAAPAPAVRAARNLALMIGAKAGTGSVGCGWALELPPSFIGVGANDYMAYAEVLGTAATTPAQEDPCVGGPARHYAQGVKAPQPPIPAVLARIESATTIMDGWPDTFHALLENLRERSGATHARDLASAFPTVVGRSLLRPRRGANGLPLHFIHEAMDEYWRFHRPARCRKRNLTVESAAALKLHSSLNATTLAVAVGDRQATGFHARILRRILNELSPEELALPPTDAADLALHRCMDRHGAVVEAITGHAAARILEGRAAKDTLSGWNHPGLLLVDPALQGLRFKDSPIYPTASVHGTLARLRAASRGPAQPHNLSPLVSVAMKLAPLRPWYDKTALLLDVLDGTVPVFAANDAPRLNDLLVDLSFLKAYVAMRNPALQSEYLTLARLNEMLQIRLGLGSVIGLEEARRLVRAGVVGIVLKKSTAANRERPVVQRLYRVADMVAAAERRSARVVSSEKEREALGVRCNIAEMVTKLREEGNTLRGTARALSRSGVRTVNGAWWTHSSVRAALKHAEAGQQVIAMAFSTKLP